MIPIIEITHPALDGKPMLEKDYDMRVFSPKVRDLVKEYGISFDPNTLVPSDDGLADSIFKAAVDLICCVGIYCKDTERVIAFNEKEVRNELKTSLHMLCLEKVWSNEHYFRELLNLTRNLGFLQGPEESPFLMRTYS